MIRSSIGYFSTPHIAVQSRQSSTTRTTSLAILALAPSEKGKGCRKATCSCRLWASPPFSATLAALTQHSNHTQHGIQQTSTPPCQPTGFRVASQQPQHSAAAHPVSRTQSPPSDFHRAVADRTGPVWVLRRSPSPV
jgi:hypothetical protein